MSLKILVLPSLLIATLIISIGYIKPDIVLLFEKKTVLEKRITDVVGMEQVIKNVEGHNNVLDENIRLSEFLSRYYPNRSDQESAIDSINFLATQSGLSVLDIQVIPPEKTPASVADETVIDQAMSADPMAVATPQIMRKKITPNSYSVEMRLLGSYDSAKLFFARMSNTNRFGVPVEFSVHQPDSKNEKSTAPSGSLEVTAEIDLPYTPVINIASALYDPVFQKTSIDLSVIERALEMSTSQVPALNISNISVGKPNPFQ